MDEEQRLVASQFVDELLDIRAMGHPPIGRQILTTAPLFCVPKDGQPEQCRVIANMRDGGQSLVVRNDPVFLHRVDHMLEQNVYGKVHHCD